MLAVLALSVALAGGASAQPRYLLDEPGLRELGPEALAERPGLFPAALGERLEYEVGYLGVPVGSFRMEVARFVERDGVRLAHVVCVARSNDVFSRLYPIYDLTEAWVDIDRMRTVRARSYTTRGSKEVFYDLRLDWKTHFAHLLYEKRHQGKIREVDFSFGPYLHDAIDLVYQLRRAPLDPGFRARFPVYASRKVYEVELAVGEVATVQTEALGRTAALPVEPRALLDGERRSGKGDVLWVDRERRIPLKLEGWPGVSSGFLASGVRAELVGYREAAPGWETPPVQSWDPPQRELDSIEGMPQWRPPADVREAREMRGLRYRNDKRYVDPEGVDWPVPAVAAPPAPPSPAPAPTSPSR